MWATWIQYIPTWEVLTHQNTADIFHTSQRNNKTIIKVASSNDSMRAGCKQPSVNKNQLLYELLIKMFPRILSCGWSDL